MEKAWADFIAADQKKTKMYIEPSKQHDINPSTKIRLSVILL